MKWGVSLFIVSLGWFFSEPAVQVRQVHNSTNSRDSRAAEGDYVRTM